MLVPSQDSLAWGALSCTSDQQKGRPLFAVCANVHLSAQLVQDPTDQRATQMLLVFLSHSRVPSRLHGPAVRLI